MNTINKWAAGICDTVALGILVEAIGKKLPIVALPFTNRAHAAHPAFGENVARLRSWGVNVLSGPGILPEHDPGTGDSYLHLPMAPGHRSHRRRVTLRYAGEHKAECCARCREARS